MLRDALLLELHPGEAFMQESSVVLLAGKLLMTGKADSVPLQQHAGRPHPPSPPFLFVSRTLLGASTTAGTPASIVLTAHCNLVLSPQRLNSININ